MSTRFSPPSRTSSRRSKARGFAVAGRASRRAGSRSRPGSGPRRRARSRPAPDRDRPAPAGPRGSAGPVRCRPSRRCRRSSSPSMRSRRCARLRPVGGTGLDPERQRVAAMHAVGASGRGHHAEEHDPRRPCARGCAGRAAAARPRQATTGRSPMRVTSAIDRRHQQVEQRHAQQLVVEGRHAERAEQRVEREDADAVATRRRSRGRAACAARWTDRSRAGAGRGRPPTESRVSTKYGTPVDGAVERAQTEERHRGRGGDVGGREEVHHDQADEEEHQVDARAEAEGRVDFLRPGHRRCVPVTMSTSEKSARANADGIEDVDAPAVAFPLDEGLAEEADGDEQELEGEPVVLEPQEEVGAEDDRNRPEARRRRAAGATTRAACRRRRRRAPARTSSGR